MSETTFSVAELEEEQRLLSSIAERTAAAARSAGDLGIGDWKMYGIFVSPVACSVLAIVDASHTRTFDELASLSGSMADCMATTAQSYAATEQGNADLAHGISAAVGQGPRA